MNAGLVEIRADAIAPCGDRVLIRVEIAPEKVGRIVIPDKARMPSTVGLVIARGPEVEQFREGQRVMIGRYTGNVIEGHEDLILVREEDILAEIIDT